MNYIREAITYLENYENLLVAKRQLKEKIIILQENVKSISYSDLPKTKCINPDDAMVNKVFELDKSKKLLKENEQALKDIERALQYLTLESKRILQLWYIQGKSEAEALMILNISRRTFYRLKSQAIRTFAVQLFGVRVIS